jgi:ribonucleoside-diphosphate reductase alpha chain
MMAAVQPFISGAISKTVNLPHDATTEDVEQAYTDAWKLGLKAIAVYRDGSKRSQPLSTSRKQATFNGQEGTEPAPAARPARHRLPSERAAITHKFDIQGHEGYLTVGLYEDGQPGEIFLKMAKEGSTLSGMMDSFATSVSVALQYGVPLRLFCAKFAHTRFEPAGSRSPSRSWTTSSAGWRPAIYPPRTGTPWASSAEGRRRWTVPPSRRAPRLPRLPAPPSPCPPALVTRVPSSSSPISPTATRRTLPPAPSAAPSWSATVPATSA